MRTVSSSTFRSLSIFLASLTLAACGFPPAALGQELSIEGVVAHTGYDDLEWPAGVAARLGRLWLGLEVAGSWSRDRSTRRGVPCSGLIPPGSTDCVEQALDVTGTMTTASLSRPIPIAGDRARLFLVPGLGFAALTTERTGAVSERSIASDRRLLRLGLAAEVHGPIGARGALRYTARLYGGSLLSGGATCVDCFEAFRDDVGEARLSVGVTYRWSP